MKLNEGDKRKLLTWALYSTQEKPGFRFAQSRLHLLYLGLFDDF
jgi:hypothetical protein